MHRDRPCGARSKATTQALIYIRTKLRISFGLGLRTCCSCCVQTCFGLLWIWGLWKLSCLRHRFSSTRAASMHAHVDETVDVVMGCILLDHLAASTPHVDINGFPPPSS